MRLACAALPLSAIPSAPPPPSTWLPSGPSASARWLCSTAAPIRKDETLRAMFATVRRLDQVYPSLDAYLAAMQALPFYQPWTPALDAYFRADVRRRPRWRRDPQSFRRRHRARPPAALPLLPVPALPRPPLPRPLPSPRTSACAATAATSFPSPKPPPSSNTCPTAAAPTLPASTITQCSCMTARQPLRRCGCSLTRLYYPDVERLSSAVRRPNLCYNPPMDILLAHGYFLAEDAHEQQVMKPYPTLGLLYLSAYLKQQGYGVERVRRHVSPPGRFRGPRARRAAGGGRPLHQSHDQVQRPPDDHRVPAVGARVILGGPEPASYAAEYLARGADVIVVGEGELTLADLLARRFQRSATRCPASPSATTTARCSPPPRGPTSPSSTRLPFPDRDAIDLDRYVRVWKDNHGLGSVSLICARGCPFHCQWCSHAVYGHTHRRRTPANVADELALLLERYQPDQVWYADDVLHHPPPLVPRIRKDCSRSAGSRRPSSASRGPTAWTTTSSRRSRKWAATACGLAPNSGSQRVLDLMKRGTQAEDVRAKTRLLQKARHPGGHVHHARVRWRAVV